MTGAIIISMLGGSRADREEPFLPSALAKTKIDKASLLCARLRERTKMSEATTPSSVPRADPAVALIEALRSSGGELAGALLELVERLDLPFAVKDAASGQYRYANARMASLFGTTPEGMVGTADAQWLEASQWPPLRTAENAALAMPHGALTEHKLDLGGARREFGVARIAVRSAQGEGACRNKTSHAGPLT